MSLLDRDAIAFGGHQRRRFDARRSGRAPSHRRRVASHGVRPTSPLHRALGLTDDELADIATHPRPRAQPPRAGDVRGDVVGALLVQVVAASTCGGCPTEAPWVLVGPGEGAGVVDVGDGIAVAIRIESHNHPSAVEPYQGAATGVGGIIRDIFSMGARPIALMDPLRFGPLDDAAQPLDRRGRRVAASPATATRSACPTVGGEVVFDETLRRATRWSTCSASACCPRERLVLGRADGRRQPRGAARLVDRPRRHRRRERARVGRLRRRGRRGQAPVACRSATRSRRSGSSRRASSCSTPASSSACRTSARPASPCAASARPRPRAASGMDVDVAAVPQREPGMEPFEVMTSESQERMLAIVAPERPRRGARALRSGGRSAAVGRSGTRRPAAAAGCASSTGFDGEVLADVPAASPRRRRPALRPAPRRAGRPRPRVGPTTRARCRRPADCGADLLDAARATRRGCGRQYDHQLFLNTVEGPGGDAAVLRLKHPTTGVDTGRGLGAHHRRQPPLVRRSTRGTGTALVVVEAALNLACVGARPLGARQLPQLRQPRAPRGDVAVLRGRSTAWARRAARSASRSSAATSASTTSRRGARHRPDAGRRRARPDRPTSTRRPPGVGLRRRRRASCCSAHEPRRARRLASGPALHGPPRRHAARRSTSTSHAALHDLVREPRRRAACVAGVHDVSDGGLGGRAGRDGGRGAASASTVATGDRRPRSRCSPSRRRGSCCRVDARPAPTPWSSARAAAGVAGRRPRAPPVATASSVDGAFDVALADATARLARRASPTPSAPASAG